MPGYHFVDHCISILNHDKDYNKVKLYEHAVAHSGLPENVKQEPEDNQTTTRRKRKWFLFVFQKLRMLNRFHKDETVLVDYIP